MNALFITPLILILFLYLRFVCKRLRLLFSLRKAAKHADAKISLVTPTFWFPTNRRKCCELIVTGDDFIYSIKVIGLFQKYCDLHFWSSREYGTRKYLLRFQIDQSTPLGSKDTRHKHLDIDFSVGMPEDTIGKQVLRFYLLSPTNFPIHITKNDGNMIVDLLPGNKIDNIIFADREYLYQYIALRLHERTSKQ